MEIFKSFLTLQPSWKSNQSTNPAESTSDWFFYILSLSITSFFSGVSLSLTLLSQKQHGWLLYSLSVSPPNLSSPWLYHTYFSKTQIRTGYPFLCSRTSCVSHRHQNSSSQYGLYHLSIITSYQTPFTCNIRSQNLILLWVHLLLIP